MSGDLDLVPWDRLTPEELADACQRAIDACEAGVAEITSLASGVRTYENTMLALEDAVEPVALASGAYAFLAYVSADDGLRQVAREWDERLDKYLVGLSFREDLYEAVREFAATEEAKALGGEDARYVAFELRDYRRNGFELPRERRDRLRELMDELVAIGVEFRNNIDDYDDGIEVTREQLAGMPDAWVARLRTVERDGRLLYRVSLDYPEIQPFMANCPDSGLRRALFEKDQRKGGRRNVELLERALAIRREAAELLGYASWADYRTETRMAGTRRAVEEFLTDLQAKVAVKAEQDFAAMRAFARERTGSDEVNIWDWRYWHNEQLKAQYAVDEFEVAQYFPLDAVIKGLFTVYQQVLGVVFTESREAPRWHPDVRAFDISEATGGPPFARFYMDLFPRPNKYGHAAAFTLRRGRRRRDGSYQKPVSAIVANFTKPSATEPSLLRHSEVITFFHEFGHIMHQTLTRAERARFSGTQTERDFVEAPSQMLEHWCWEPEVLGAFARHWRTGEPLPLGLIEAMVAAKNLNSGIMTLRQIFFATLDLRLHSPGFDGDSTRLVAELHGITGFPFTPGTHFQSGFGHLFGYDAGYYGYLWSHVFGDDMYTLFEEAGPLSGEVGRRYRTTILERGGSVDGQQLVRDFLGREPNSEAFLRGLGLAVSGRG
ncbi:M3 family metallopeptidase [Tepidiforma sp.]|uniref:M3 family metallopeptidase n=1 Tax=Tepidiforma sp. TaxID=2682230 RepID=UPI002ADD4FE1|nr:M3 family metallopeptidase [Tepidiforma sp.]